MNVKLSAHLMHETAKHINLHTLASVNDVAVALKWMDPTDAACDKYCFPTAETFEQFLASKLQHQELNPTLIAVFLADNEWDVFFLCESQSGYVLLAGTEKQSIFLEPVIEKISKCFPSLLFKRLPDPYSGDRLRSWNVIRCCLKICCKYMTSKFLRFRNFNVADNSLRDAILIYISDSLEKFIEDCLSKICLNPNFLKTFQLFFRGQVLPTKEYEEYIDAVEALAKLDYEEDSLEADKFFNDLQAKRQALLHSYKRETDEFVSHNSAHHIKDNSTLLSRYAEMDIVNKLFNLISQFTLDKRGLEKIKEISTRLGIDYDKLLRYLKTQKLSTTTTSIDKEFIKDIKALTEIPTFVTGLNSLKEDLTTTNEFISELCKINIELWEKNMTTLSSDIQLLLSKWCNLIDLYFCSKDHYTLEVGEKEFSNKSINSWTKEDIFDWAVNEQRKKTFSLSDNDENLCLMLAILDRAHQLLSFNGCRFRKAQLISALCFLRTNLDKGLVAQIGTGEGKTTIISILAVIKVFQGYSVDVITSNDLLPLQAITDKLNFYSMLNVSVATNNYDKTYKSGPRSCYIADVVYGSISSFQFDYLGTSFDKLGTLGSRSFTKTWVILDEIDSLLIDQGSHIAKVSTKFAGMEFLRYIYIEIWKGLRYFEEKVDSETNEKLRLKAQELKEAYISETQQQEIYDRYVAQLRSEFLPTIFECMTQDSSLIPLQLVPSHFKEFVDRKKEIWIRSSLLARFDYRENVSYRIVESPATQERDILLVDNQSTGAMMKNTILSNGLHQFLQLKHNLQLSMESLTCSFVSNIAYILKYEQKLYGLTGTLGSSLEQELLKHVYNIQYAIIPSAFKANEFIEYPMKTVEVECFVDAVTVSALKQVMNSPRAVLIVCESIYDVECIHKSLLTTARGAGIPISLSKICDEEVESSTRYLHDREIIVATNIAGRGADFRTSIEVESNGGLHVIVAFLPTNQRVQRQAFGRTCRQGNRGSAQIIFKNDALTDLGLQIDNHDVSIVLNQRDECENNRIQNIKKYKLIELSFADKLFEKFMILILKMENNRNSDGNIHEPSVAAKWFHLTKDVKEHWSFWLDQQNYCFDLVMELYSKYGISEIDILVEREFSFFENSVNSRVIGFAIEWYDPANCIALANDYLDNCEFQLAKTLLAVLSTDSQTLPAYQLKMFEVSIDEGQEFYLKLYQAIGKVFTLGLVDSEAMNPAEYKKNATKFLTKAKLQIEVESSYLQRLLDGRSSFSSPYEYSQEDICYLLNCYLLDYVGNLSENIVMDRKHLSVSKCEQRSWVCFGQRVYHNAHDSNAVSTYWSVVYFQSSGTSTIVYIITANKSIISLVQDSFRGALDGGDIIEFHVIDLYNVQGEEAENSSNIIKNVSGPLAVYHLVHVLNSTSQERALNHSDLSAYIITNTEVLQAEISAQFTELDKRDRYGLYHIVNDSSLISMTAENRLANEVRILQSVIDEGFDLFHSIRVISFSPEDKFSIDPNHSPLFQEGDNINHIFILVRILERHSTGFETVWMPLVIGKVGHEIMVCTYFPKQPRYAAYVEAVMLTMVPSIEATSNSFPVIFNNTINTNGKFEEENSLWKALFFFEWMKSKLQYHTLRSVSDKMIEKFSFSAVFPTRAFEIAERFESRLIEPGPNYFLKHMKSRNCCLSVCLDNIRKVLDDLTDENSGFSKSDGVAMGCKLELSKQFEGSGADESSVANLITATEVQDLSRCGIGCLYSLRTVTLVENDIIWSARSQIGFGLSLLGAGAMFPLILPSVGPIANVFISEGITDIISALASFESTSYSRWEYVKGKLWSYAKSFGTLAVNALMRCQKLLRQAIKYCKKISKFLRKSTYFPNLCRTLSKGANKLEKLFKSLSLKSSFGYMNKSQQEQFLSRLKDSRMKNIRVGKLKNLWHMKQFHSLSKLKKVTDEFSRRTFIFNVITQAVQKPLVSFATAVFTEKVISTSVQLIMVHVKPRVNVFVDLEVQNFFRQLDKSFLKIIMESEKLVIIDSIDQLNNERCSSNIYESIKGISVNICCLIKSWKSQLSALLIETLDTILTLNDCVLQFLERFVRIIKKRFAACIDDKSKPSSSFSRLEELEDQLSDVISQSIYRLISNISARIIVTVPQICLAAYEERKEVRQIEKLDRRLQNIVNADRNAQGMTCVYDSIGTIMQMNRDQLADSSGLLPSNTGATLDDARSLMRAVGVEEIEEAVSIESATDCFRKLNSDRGLLLFPGHCEACFLGEDGQPSMNLTDGRSITVQEYCSERNLPMPLFLIGSNCNENTLPQMYQNMCRQRILHAYESVNYAGASAGPLFGGGNKVEQIKRDNAQKIINDWKKFNTSANKIKKTSFVEIDKKAKTLNVGNCRTLLQQNREKLIPSSKQVVLFENESIHVDYKPDRGYELQLTKNMKCSGNLTTVVSVNIPTEIYDFINKVESNTMISQEVNKTVCEKLLEGLDLFENREKESGVQIILGKADFKNTLEEIESTLNQQYSRWL